MPSRHGTKLLFYYCSMMLRAARLQWQGTAGGAAQFRGSWGPPSTSHTLAHQDPVPHSTWALGRADPLMALNKVWATPGFWAQAAGDRAGESCAQKEVCNHDLQWRSWVGCVGGTPMWGFSGQLRLVNIIILVTGGELVRLLKAGTCSAVYYFAQKKCKHQKLRLSRGPRDKQSP